MKKLKVILLVTCMVVISGCGKNSARERFIEQGDYAYNGCNYEEAIDKYMQAKEYDDQDEDIYEKLLDCYINEEMYEEAKDIITEAKNTIENSNLCSERTEVDKLDRFMLYDKNGTIRYVEDESVR